MLFLWVVRRRCSGPFIGPSRRQRPSARIPLATLDSPTLRPAWQESLPREPLQDIVVAVSLQHGAGGDPVPGERTVVHGLPQGATEFLVGAWERQVRVEGAEQDKVAGGERFRGEPDERIRSSMWISLPSLAQQTHGLPLKPSHRTPVTWPPQRSGCDRRVAVLNVRAVPRRATSWSGHVPDQLYLRS